MTHSNFTVLIAKSTVSFLPIKDGKTCRGFGLTTTTTLQHNKVSQKYEPMKIEGTLFSAKEGRERIIKVFTADNLENLKKKIAEYLLKGGKMG